MTLDIGSGSVVAVDTQSLRDAAARFEAAAVHVDAVRRLAGAAAHESALAVGRAQMETIASEAAATAEDVRAIAGDLRRLADVYEIVEAHARIGLAAESGPERVRAVRAWEERILAADARSPGARAEAERVIDEWEETWADELLAQASLGMDGVPGFVATLIGAMALDLVVRVGRGVVGPHERLGGGTEPVRIAPFGARPGTPVAGLADAAARIPGTAHAVVRVERLTFAGRSPEYAIYISGTREIKPGRAGETLDTRSNVQQYFGFTSASYSAVRAALRDAGAGPGATVHAFGHSQGGMIASRLALEREYRVATLVTYGSPVSVVAPPDTLSVAVRHRDDAVGTGLAGGGAAISGGAPGSVVITDTHDPGAELWSLGLDAHALDSYHGLAARADASDDPRMAATAGRVAELGAAESVTVTEYAVERVAQD